MAQSKSKVAKPFGRHTTSHSNSNNTVFTMAKSQISFLFFSFWSVGNVGHCAKWKWRNVWQQPKTPCLTLLLIAVHSCPRQKWHCTVTGDNEVVGSHLPGVKHIYNISLALVIVKVRQWPCPCGVMSSSYLCVMSLKLHYRLGLWLCNYLPECIDINCVLFIAVAGNTRSLMAYGMY